MVYISSKLSTLLTGHCILIDDQTHFGGRQRVHIFAAATRPRHVIHLIRITRGRSRDHSRYSSPCNSLRLDRLISPIRTLSPHFWIHSSFS
jgi:hypothetical protein